MRGWFLTASLTGLLALGCEEGQPKASRGTSKSLEKTRDPHSGNYPAAPAEEAEAPLDETSGVVHFGSITLTAPEGWKRKPAQSEFVNAEFVLPRSPGDEADGRLTLSVAGGSIEANIERWKGQFTALETNEQEQLEAAGVKVTLVDLSGEFNDQRGPYAPATKRSGYRMITATIPIDGRLHFVKGVGPKKTMEAQAAKIKAFLDSLKRDM